LFFYSFFFPVGPDVGGYVAVSPGSKKGMNRFFSRIPGNRLNDNPESKCSNAMLNNALMIGFIILRFQLFVLFGVVFVNDRSPTKA